jgi:fumarate hydratase class II
MKYRNEKDVLGSVRIPADAYYGSETMRAYDNFQISGIKVAKELIYAYVIVKRAAASANMDIDKLDSRKGNAIIRACDFVLSGRLDESFVLDVFQAGAGTSINMNVNEVIANKAIEMLGGRKGDYRIVHPNDDVNMSQSTNDTMPTAMRIAIHKEVNDSLLVEIDKLIAAIDKKSKEFKSIVKLGRTHLQDAVPILLGEEFSSYAYAARSARAYIKEANEKLLMLPIGGTAVGTGMNAGSKYRKAVIKEIRKLTKDNFSLISGPFGPMSNKIDELAVSASLRDCAAALNKFANDLRLLNSGPRGGIDEIKLPAVQPGSSIMPGKINPSMAEMMNMVCFQVIGNDLAVNEAANAGQLELNVYMPIIAFDILFSIKILSNGMKAFRERCVKGITANEKRIKQNLENDLSIATALTLYIGYAKAADIARRAFLQNKSVMQICLEMKIMDRKKLQKILDPKNAVK